MTESEKLGRESVDGGEDRVRRRLAVGVPIAVPGKVLAEQARDVAAGWCQRVVHRRWNQHFDDRRIGPRALAGVQVGPFHVAQA